MYHPSGGSSQLGILLNLMNVCKLPAGSVYKAALFAGNTGAAPESVPLSLYWIWFPKSSYYRKRNKFMGSVTNCNLRALLLYIRFNNRGIREKAWPCRKGTGNVYTIYHKYWQMLSQKHKEVNLYMGNVHLNFSFGLFPQVFTETLLRFSM